MLQTKVSQVARAHEAETSKIQSVKGRQRMKQRIRRTGGRTIRDKVLWRLLLFDVALLMIVGLWASGCAAWKTGTLTHKVTASQHSFKSAVQGFQDAEIAEHEKGFVPNDLHIQMQGVIQKVALAGVDLDGALAANATSATIKAKLDGIYTLLDSLESQGILGVKNANSKAILEIALNQVKTIIDVALTQVQ
jgi:hypothetical protein